MPFEFFDHTGDIGVHLSGPSLGALFEAAASAFAAAITDLHTVQGRTSDSVSLAGSPDLETLLVDWLSELLFRFEAQNLLVCEASVSVQRDVEGFRLDARISGETFDPARHGIKVLIKGVTYHGLHVEQGPDGWHARVIFDI